jgi:hypothetical protein
VPAVVPGRESAAAGGASTARGAVSTSSSAAASAALGAWRGSFTAREPGVKLGLKLPTHSGEFSDAEQTRKESILKASEGECTAIESTGMYVGGEMVARNASLLRSHKITHVLNMAGVTVPNFLEADGFEYLTLYMHDGGDTAAEDFRSALPRILEWLDAALKPPARARILVHVRLVCPLTHVASVRRSRATSLCIHDVTVPLLKSSRADSARLALADRAALSLRTSCGRATLLTTKHWHW